ncbi:hypothetical protein LQZ19_15940 [Treponema primitia]
MPFCKYCGKELRPSGSQGLFASGTGLTCKNSPTKKHQLAASSVLICQYCGKPLRTSGGSDLFASGSGLKCTASPNGKHSLV